MDDYGTVFDALGDPVRRAVIARLLQRDGQRADELASALGVARSTLGRHAAVLERAGLVSVLRAGTERQHWLRVAPLVGLERWLVPFRARWVEASEGALEWPRAVSREGGTGGGGLSVVLESHIRCSAERLWLALTSGRSTSRYFFGCRVVSSWIPRSPVEFRGWNGTVRAQGVVLECEPHQRLAFTWEVLEGVERSDPPSQVSFRIEESTDRCRLTLVHSGLVAGSYPAALEGWRLVLDSLKSLLETGASLQEVTYGRRLEARAARALRRRVDALLWRA